MIRYCRRCVMPETKPDIFFDDEGVCSACRHFAARDDVDWDRRRTELEEILGRYRSPTGDDYDCIVPVSGGKDSTFQTLRVIQLGLNPLFITSSTCKLTPIGRRNLDNLKRLGVDRKAVNNFTVMVNDVGQLRQVMSTIEKQAGVTSVERVST